MMCMTKYTFIDYMKNPIHSLVICDNRGGFLPFMNYDATELFQHSNSALCDSKREKRHCERAYRASGRDWKCIDGYSPRINSRLILLASFHHVV